MKKYRLSYEQIIEHTKIIEAENLEEAKKQYDKEIEDLSGWQKENIGFSQTDVCSNYEEIQEIE